MPRWKGRCRETTLADALEQSEYSSGLLQLANFDLARVLERGAPLLASGGTVCGGARAMQEWSQDEPPLPSAQEFDEPTDDMNSAEKLALQRKQIRAKIGLLEQFDTDNFIAEEDLRSAPRPPYALLSHVSIILFLNPEYPLSWFVRQLDPSHNKQAHA
jgi:hypothetical protein